MGYQVAKALKDLDGAEQHLAAIQKDGDGYTVRLLLAGLAKAKKDKDGYRVHLEAAYRFDPTQPEALKGLLQLAIDDKKDVDQLVILRRYTQIEQHDQDAWTLYLGLLVEQKQWAEAVATGESAIFVDVHSPLVHMLYGKALVETNDAPRAIYELESALLCKPAKNDGASIHALLARALVMQGKTAEAKAHADEAKKVDPTNEELKLVHLP